MDGKECNDNGGFLEISAQRKDGGSSAWLLRRLETPSTPGRPVFSFSAGNLYRKSVPSKWDDAGKWLMTSSFLESPVHRSKLSEPSKAHEQKDHQKADTFDTFVKKLSLSESKLSKVGHGKDMPSHGIPSEVLLKDKLTRNVETVGSNFRCIETSKEGLMFKNSFCETEKDAVFVPVVPSRDVGTEMTPICSLTTSRCHTPIKSSSPSSAQYTG
ncbi:hypothetical protein HPP92_026046 [Vanilla planifolia]|uniref:Uncharacterized protein n=1 Tax=Vanilla planifolia TaxID=51239 RepID=A0A835U8C7_VANPL|nr:hypothetical protein HPP92_026319 [Vanilla planifolia]KAG0451788.1 hypothetical protein HPP92_026046 [Vanilla planifolia]